MSVEGSGLILLAMISVLVLFASASVLILLSNVVVVVLLTEKFSGVLTIIWYILMVECIYKVPANNGFNH